MTWVLLASAKEVRKPVGRLEFRRRSWEKSTKRGGVAIVVG